VEDKTMKKRNEGIRPTSQLAVSERYMQGGAMTISKIVEGRIKGILW
jgi:hypothetical protein